MLIRIHLISPCLVTIACDVFSYGILSSSSGVIQKERMVIVCTVWWSPGHWQQLKGDHPKTKTGLLIWQVRDSGINKNFHVNKITIWRITFIFATLLIRRGKPLPIFPFILTKIQTGDILHPVDQANILYCVDLQWGSYWTTELCTAIYHIALENKKEISFPGHDYFRMHLLMNDYLLKTLLFYYYVWFFVNHLCSGTCESQWSMDLVELDLLSAMIHHVILEREHGFSARGVYSLNYWAISLSSKALSLYCQQPFPTKNTLPVMCEMAYISHGWFYGILN